jgi:hypothetical protein
MRIGASIHATDRKDLLRNKSAHPNPTVSFSVFARRGQYRLLNRTAVHEAS